MNYPVIICDFLSFLLLGSGLLILIIRRKDISISHSKAVLTVLIAVMFLYNLFNLMEWTGFGDIFDTYGDFIGILMPMAWAFFFYALMQELFMREIRESETRFKNLSFYDTLTHIYNRNYFENEIHRISSDIERFKPISVFSIDIDGLKLVNDTFGHKAGDDLLMEVARIISFPFRKIDVIARIGGDEFCIVLPRVNEATALAKRTQIDRFVESYNAKHPAIPISLSIGTATSSQEKDGNIFSLTKKADNNMYEHKLLKTRSKKGAVIDLLLSALEERDFIAGGHAQRLSNLAGMMADELKLNEDERTNLVLVAKLHDIGKIGVSDTILFKKGKLSGPEYDNIKKHSEIGHKIAVRSQELTHISDLILHHHESWDGSGYPSGLKRTQIPLACRILSILDAYDAMVNERPYHPPIPQDQAIIELKRDSGKKFDPEILNVFLKLIKKK